MGEMVKQVSHVLRRKIDRILHCTLGLTFTLDFAIRLEIPMFSPSPLLCPSRLKASAHCICYSQVLVILVELYMLEDVRCIKESACYEFHL